MTYILYKKIYDAKVFVGEYESLDTLANTIAHAAVLAYRDSGRTPEFHIETAELPRRENAIHPASSYGEILNAALVEYGGGEAQ